MSESLKPFRSVAEFENILKGQAAVEKMNEWRALYSTCYRSDFQKRKALLITYYNIPETTVDMLLKYPHQQRKQLCWEQGINPYIFSTLFDYTRYPECYELYRYMEQKIDFKQFTVLDYGCLVADYGFFFGMLGSKISICDLKEYADFASFRLSKHRISHTTHYAPLPYPKVTGQIGLAIFGEVLEHLNDPLDMFKACIENHVPYIYTTCYPYGDDAYFNLPGHSKEAQRQAPESLYLLQTHYHEIPFKKYRRLWIRK